VTALVAILLLLLGEAGVPAEPDAGVGAPPATRSAEDEEIIRNLDLLEHLADREGLEMVLDLERERTKLER